MTALVRSTLLALLALAVGRAAAAQSPSVLSLLPVEDEPLEMDAEHTGTLSSADYLTASDSYLDAWEMAGPVGSSVTVTLSSDDFDAYLYVVGPGLGETLADDDSAGGCHARIDFTFLESGPYRVVASSLSTRATGTYRLGVAEQPPPTLSYACGDPDPRELATLPTDDRVLAMGSTVTGSFDLLTATVDGRVMQAWRLPALTGEPLSVVLESDDFDAYLYVLGPGITGALGDDDSAGDLNSRVDFTPASEGPYTVVASALGANAALGSYRLRVEEPPDLGALPAIGQLTVGEEASGYLEASDPTVVDGRGGQVWSLEGTAGDRVTIELVSDAFDAFLYVAGPGLAEPLSDDDGAGNLDSRIALTFPETGSYRVIASSLGGSETGSYTLRVTAR